MKRIFVFLSFILFFLLVILCLIFKPILAFVFLELIIFLLVIINALLPNCYEKMFEKLENKIIKIDQLGIEDIINNKSFYREILNRYSIGELYYVDVFEEDNKTLLILTLLMLIKKKAIKIEDNKIIRLMSTSNKLSKSEKYVFSNITNKGKIYLNDVYDISSIVKKETINDNLMCLGKNKFRSLLLRLLLIINVLFVIWIVITNYIPIKFNHQIEIQIFIVPILIILLNVLLLVKIYDFRREIYKRTEEGSDLNNKLNGLKHFIKEFSNLDNKELQDIKLWEDYFIYSVMFGINKKSYRKIEKELIIKK